MDKVGLWVKKHWLAAIILAGTVVVFSWTLLTRPMFHTHDYLHGARIAEMTRGLLEGQWPVIWSENFGWGYGMPLFEFYAPLPYFLGALIHLLGVDLVWCTKILWLAVSVVTLWGSYKWAREWFSIEVAALSASMSALASYRAMDLFARGAMSELWAMAALPWLLCGLTRLIRDEKHYQWYIVGGGVVLILSHNITTMLAAPVLLLYIVAEVALERAAHLSVWDVVKRLATWAVACLGLTAFYLLPALIEKELTQVNTWILGDYFNFRLHFVYFRQFWRDNFGYGGSGWGPDDGLSFFLGWAQWAGVAIGAGARVASAKEWWHHRQKLHKV